MNVFCVCVPCFLIWDLIVFLILHDVLTERMLSVVTFVAIIFPSVFFCLLIVFTIILMDRRA